MAPIEAPGPNAEAGLRGCSRNRSAGTRLMTLLRKWRANPPTQGPSTASLDANSFRNESSCRGPFSSRSVVRNDRAAGEAAQSEQADSLAKIGIGARFQS